MGTNYYWCEEQYDECLHCGHKNKLEDIRRHIGKSSGGWCFSLHVYPEEGINTLTAWIHLMVTRDNGRIQDEYGKHITMVEMLQQIMCRAWTTEEKIQSEEWYSQNQAIKGPKGLARYKMEHGCVGHGENNGTWDYVKGDFS